VKDHYDVWPRCQELRGLSEVITNSSYEQGFSVLSPIKIENRNFLLQEFQVMCMFHLSTCHFYF